MAYYTIDVNSPYYLMFIKLDWMAIYHALANLLYNMLKSKSFCISTEINLAKGVVFY